MSFLDTLAQNTNQAVTENYGAAKASTLDFALDFFAMGGAMRSRPEDFVRLFEKAYADNPQVALRTLFYIRDVRGGQGERDLFRKGLAALKKLDPEVYAKNVVFTAEYGRWDDIVAMDLTSVELEVLADQFRYDRAALFNGKSVSLLAKWLPSENASSKTTKAKALQFMKRMGMTPREYRKVLSELRSHINILEALMSAGKWEDIDFSKLPSQAMRKHSKAFRRHVETSFEAYLASVEKGEAKINTSTLYTYEIFDILYTDPKLADVQWSNLPDWTQGNNALVVADVSGSMHGRPLSVSVSLALYFAERNTGPFKNYFMTFSERPQLVKVVGSTLQQKMNFINRSHWEMNTNLEAVFDTVLKSAVASKALSDDLPKVIYIISDMEFDRCTTASETVFEAATRKFAEVGYTLPHIVFWNVDARNDHLPATKFDNHVTLISGMSQSTFRYAVEGKSPMEFMLDTVNSERYARLTV